MASLPPAESSFSRSCKNSIADNCNSNATNCNIISQNEDKMIAEIMKFILKGIRLMCLLSYLG